MDEGPHSASHGEPDELQLIARIRRRDVEAFEELYRAYHPRLTRFLFHLVNRAQTVEEVLDDTLMVVWERADTFRGESKLSTWIFTIAYRKAIRARRGDDPVLEDEAIDQRISPEATPEEECRRSRAQAMLAEALLELSPDHRAVVDLTYFHEMGYREIAEIMSCPVDTVKTRMFYARRHLKRRLQGEAADWL